MSKEEEFRLCPFVASHFNRGAAKDGDQPFNIFLFGTEDL
jgi:hypothetical protein